MKIILLNLLLLFTGTVSFAQSNLMAEVDTELKEFLVEYNKSPYDFFKNRSTPDFRYTDGNGSFVLRAAVLKNSEGRPSTQSEVSDLKTFQSGNLAVVSGIHTFEGGGKVAFTYTLEKLNGKWMFAASQHTPVKKTP